MTEKEAYLPLYLFGPKGGEPATGYGVCANGAKIGILAEGVTLAQAKLICEVVYASFDERPPEWAAPMYAPPF